MALRPSYKGDIYCKWYVIMFGLWLFECFTPPLKCTGNDHVINETFEKTCRLVSSWFQKCLHNKKNYKFVFTFTFTVYNLYICIDISIRKVTLITCFLYLFHYVNYSMITWTSNRISSYSFSKQLEYTHNKNIHEHTNVLNE